MASRTASSSEDVVDLYSTSSARSVAAKSTLFGLLRTGAYVSIRKMLDKLVPAELAMAIDDLLSEGYSFERAGKCLRIRTRERGERRQGLAEVVGGLDLTRQVKSISCSESSLVAGGASEQLEFDLEADAGGEGGEKGLVLSDPPSVLTLPYDACAGMTGAILAQRGSGKTYMAMVLVEEILRMPSRPSLVVLDPTGVWWGLLATSDGRPGDPMLLFGGQRGHLSVGAKDGRRVARVVEAVRPLPVVVDLSDLAPTEQHEFAAGFCEGLMGGERFSVVVVVDEADEFAPQRSGALGEHQKRSRSYLERMVMRGRARGIGAVLISLRPAVLSKNLLAQVDWLSLLRMVESNDLRAVGTWLENFEHQVTDEQRIGCLSQLPVLPSGTAYFLRGGERSLFRRFRVRRKHTYDSSRTLGAGMGSGGSDRVRLSSPSREVLERVAAILTASGEADHES